MVIQFSAGLLSASDKPRLPDFELRVLAISGNPLHKSPDHNSWQPLEEDQLIEQGSHIQTRSGSISLGIAGNSYIKADKETELMIDKLNQTFQTRGLLLRQEKYTARRIELEIIRGKITARSRYHDNIETDFRIKTLTSVAAIRGTTFECSSDFDGRTTVKVLDGYINFYNRFKPENSRLLGPGLKTTLSKEDTMPADPSPLDRDEVQTLYSFRQEASQKLLMPPYLEKLWLNGRPFSRSQHTWNITYPYSRSDTLTISGAAKVREQRADISRVELNFHGQEMETSGIEEWKSRFTLTPPPEGRKIDLEGQAVVHDDLGSVARPQKINITLFHPEEEPVIPEELLAGEVPVKVQKIGKMLLKDMSFPYEISQLDLARHHWEDHLDTGPLAYPDGMKISGIIDSDSPVEGVAYSLNGGRDWHLASETADWQFTISDDSIRSQQQFSVGIVAWTKDGYRGQPETLGPFQYRTLDMPYPFEYELGDVYPRVIAIGSEIEPQFPLEITNAALAGENLSVRGIVEAESEIAGVAYRVNRGEWQYPTGLEEWHFNLPSGRSANFNVEIIAWSEERILSEPLNFTINFNYIEPTLPRDYKRTTMPFEISSIASFPVDEISFPFHTYRDDAEAEGLAIRGILDVDTPLEGMAVSFDGGSSWDRIEPHQRWVFHLPHRVSREFYAIRLLAWTVDGRVSQVISMDNVRHSSSTIDGALREQFARKWRPFEARDVRTFIDRLDDNFVYLDSESGEHQNIDDFRWFLQDFFRNIRNLNVTYSISNIQTGPDFAKLNCYLEWRGLFDRPDRPFLMFGRDSSFDYIRQDNGLFKAEAMRNFPPVVFLYHRRAIRIPDLGGLSISDLNIHSSTHGADILAEVTTPDFSANYAELGLGGDVMDGGIMELRAEGFQRIEKISTLSSVYRQNQPISPGEFYAVNIRDLNGNPSTALIKVISVSTGAVEIQIISGRPAPGLRSRPITRYREVNPFD